MSALPESVGALPPAPAPVRAFAVDRYAAFAVALGLLAAYLPTWWDFTVGRAAADAQGHEPMVLAISAWLLWRERDALAALDARPRLVPAAALLAIGTLMYLFGRSQQFLRIELVSQVFVLAALLVGFKGWPALRRAWFPLFFLLFVVPLPYALVMTLTAPLKAGVSAVTTTMLGWIGYPTGRSGVIITIGQYELLVSTACAGLQTMFTLEAMGLVYINLKGYGSALRNTLLALLIVPVSFCANVVRVTALALVTYHFGDDAGRGFFHGFAGMVLFLAALLLIMSADRALTWLLPERHSR
jgi:exosortase B